MIRKAAKNGIEIQMDDKSNLDLFYSLFYAANSRNGLETFGINFFIDLFQSVKNISFDILWAKQNNSMLACLVLAKDKDYAIYWLGFTVEGSPNAGQGELLQWDAIKRAKNAGCRYYDLCTIEKDRLPHRFHGLPKGPMHGSG